MCVNSSIAVGPPTPSPSSTSVLWVSTDIHLVRAPVRLCRGRVAAVVSCRSKSVCTMVHVLQRIPSAATPLPAQRKPIRGLAPATRTVALRGTVLDLPFTRPVESFGLAHFHHQWLAVWRLDNTLSVRRSLEPAAAVPQCGCTWASAKSCSDLFSIGRTSCWSHLDVLISNCVRIKRHCEVIDNSDVTRWLRLATFSLRTAFHGSVCYMEMN